MSKKPFDALTFGEVMLRLSPAGRDKLARSDMFEKHTGGAELNVACGIAQLGLKSGYITKLPNNEISNYIKNKIQENGVSTQYVVGDDSPNGRVGIYYYQNGASPRKPAVVYDRKNSSVTTVKIDEIPAEVYESTRLFHVTGISLAISDNACEVAGEMMKRFKEAGALVSFDVNYRANLWSEEKAKAAIQKILPLVDILFISEETSRRMFGKTGELKDIIKSYCKEYGVSIVGTTKREIISPSMHNFGSVIYSAKEDKFYTEPAYEGIEIVDRIGSGDSFVAGALYGLLKYDDCQKAVEYGNALAALKCTTRGDLPQTDYNEATKIIEAHRSTGIQSEMDR